MKTKGRREDRGREGEGVGWMAWEREREGGDTLRSMMGVRVQTALPADVSTVTNSKKSGSRLGKSERTSHAKYDFMLLHV